MPKVKSLKNDAFGINTLRENGILKTDTLDKANICNRQFQSAFTRESEDEIPSKGTSPFTPMGEITVDPNGVLKLLNNLKIHKAPGPDGLSARVLKECSSEIAPILALIYNETLAQGTVPDDWRQANVAPIFKKGEKYDAANYRPVSLTCICCKTLEHIIVSNINKHLAFESILADCQHGFRSQRSCETQLVQFFHDLVSNLDRALNRNHRQISQRPLTKYHTAIVQIRLLRDKRIYSQADHFMAFWALSKSGVRWPSLRSSPGPIWCPPRIGPRTGPISHFYQ